MPRSDDYDDYDDYRPSRSDVPFPSGVKAAGFIWIAFGVLGVLNAGLSFLMTAAGAAANAGQPGQGNPCGVGCGVIFAIAFLVVGVQTVKGTAKGTLGNGIGSLVFGLLYGAIAVLVIAMANQFPGGPNPLIFVIAAISGVLAVALLTAGALAIMGRTAYAEWLAAHGRVPGRPRRRTIEEEDYDDERRPRRDRDDEDGHNRPRRERDSDDER
jgi:hypothetical protein